MNNKEFSQAISELRDCHKLTDAEQTFLKNIDSQIAEHEQTITESRKRISDIKTKSYLRISGKMLGSEEFEAQKLRETIKDSEASIKKLDAMKPFYSDTYQALIATEEKAYSLYIKAKDQFRQADDAVQTARKGYDFDEIIKTEKAALIAKQTAEVAETAYNEACEAVKEYVPAWERIADNIRDQITASTTEEVRKLFSKVAEVLETGIKQMDSLHAEEATFDITGKGKDALWLQYHFDCDWMLQLLQEIKAYENR